MNLTLLVPADDSQPIVLHELSEGATISAQARQLFGGAWEVVRARGLHELAPLNRRGGDLYGAEAIAGDALICQERRNTFWVDELRGFTQEEAEELRDLLFRETGRGRG